MTQASVGSSTASSNKSKRRVTYIPKILDFMSTAYKASAKDTDCGTTTSSSKGASSEKEHMWTGSANSSANHRRKTTANMLFPSTMLNLVPGDGRRRSIRPLAVSVNSSITMSSSMNMLDLDDFDIEDHEGMVSSQHDLDLAASEVPVPLALAQGDNLDSDFKPLQPRRRHSGNRHDPANRRMTCRPFTSSTTSNGTMLSSITMLDFDDIEEDVPLAQPKLERGITTDSDSKPLRPFRRLSSTSVISSTCSRPARRSICSRGTVESSLTMTDWDTHHQGASSHATTLLVTPLVDRGHSLDSDCKPLRPCRRDSDSVSESVVSSGRHNDCGRGGHPRDVGHASGCHNHDDSQVVVPVVSVVRCFDAIPCNSVRSEDSKPVRPGRKISFCEIGEDVLDQVLDELGAVDFYDEIDESNPECKVQGEEVQEIPEASSPIDTAVVALVSRELRDQDA